MRITLVCNNCGHILVSKEITPIEASKANDVPHRVKVPVCSVCSKIKKEWVKK